LTILTPLQEEAVRENLKNVILFMASSGCLVSPRKDPSKETFWNETWKRIDRFLPELSSDLALEEPIPESAEENKELPSTAAEAEEVENHVEPQVAEGVKEETTA
jgi:golgi-specific brefeldin A-resistance guanine nucleotide exchange factor 1